MLFRSVASLHAQPAQRAASGKRAENERRTSREQPAPSSAVATRTQPSATPDALRTSEPPRTASTPSGGAASERGEASEEAGKRRARRSQRRLVRLATARAPTRPKRHPAALPKRREPPPEAQTAPAAQPSRRERSPPQRVCERLRWRGCAEVRRGWRSAGCGWLPLTRGRAVRGSFSARSPLACRSLPAARAGRGAKRHPYRHKTPPRA